MNRILPCECRVGNIAKYGSSGKTGCVINVTDAKDVSFCLDINDIDGYPFVTKSLTLDAAVIITETGWNFPALGVTIETVGHDPDLYLYRAKGNLNEGA